MTTACSSGSLKQHRRLRKYLRCPVSLQGNRCNQFGLQSALFRPGSSGKRYHLQKTRLLRPQRRLRTPSDRCLAVYPRCTAGIRHKGCRTHPRSPGSSRGRVRALYLRDSFRSASHQADYRSWSQVQRTDCTLQPGCKYRLDIQCTHSCLASAWCLVHTYRSGFLKVSMKRRSGLHTRCTHSCHH